MTEINTDSKISQLTYIDLFKKMLPYLQRKKILFFFVVFSILAYSGLSRTVPFIIGKAIDEGVLKNNREILIQLTWLYLIFEICKTLFTFLSNYLFQILGQRILHLIRIDLMQHTQNLPIDYYNKNQTGRIITRVTQDVSVLGELFTNGLVSIFIQVFVITSIVISMLALSLKLTLLTILSAPFFYWLALRINYKMKILLRDQKAHTSAMNSTIAESLSGIKVLQIYNKQSQVLGKIKNLAEKNFQLLFKTTKTGALMQPVINVFTAVTISTVLYYGGYLNSENILPLGTLVAFLLNTQDLIPPFREIIEKHQQFQNSLTSAERVFQLFEEKSEMILSDAPSIEKSILGNIQIRDLSFRYSVNLPWVLKNISLNIPAGHSVALVGRTGSGKSTLISLLQRFYDTEKDKIFLDQIDLLQIPKKQLRRWIGVCQQDNYIFRGSLLENITLHDNKIKEDTVLNALKEIGYWDFLIKSGRNLSFAIEEKGANISQGEKQLIAFARILVFNPQVLILDEATANIDSETELLIQNATAKLLKNRTSIIIAHRLSTIEKCHTIYVLKEGQIKESGSHKELLAINGIYAEMAQHSTID